MATTDLGAKWVFEEMWDFRRDVSQPVLLEFFKGLLTCANGDGELTEAEREWALGYCAATGATDETIAELRAYAADEDIHEVLVRGQHLGTAHRPLIYDAIRTCAADGELDDGERATLRKMASAIGVTEAELQQFEEIYAEEQRLKQRRINAVFPVGTPY
jgi:uncharacterized tellurite resistance protein B-like protein